MFRGIRHWVLAMLRRVIVGELVESALRFTHEDTQGVRKVLGFSRNNICSSNVMQSKV